MEAVEFRRRRCHPILLNRNRNLLIPNRLNPFPLIQNRLNPFLQFPLNLNLLSQNHRSLFRPIPNHPNPNLNLNRLIPCHRSLFRLCLQNPCRPIPCPRYRLPRSRSCRNCWNS